MFWMSDRVIPLPMPAGADAVAGFSTALLDFGNEVADEPVVVGYFQRHFAVDFGVMQVGILRV